MIYRSGRTLPWKILSKAGKILGMYKTKEEAEQRLNQIEYFKHASKKQKRRPASKRKTARS